MKFKNKCALVLASLVGVLSLSTEFSGTTNASTNQGNNPISKVATTGFDKKQVLEVNNQPFFYNGVQIRVDKLRDKYGYNMDDIQNAFKQAKSDGFTVINSQILWSDVQKDQTLTPTDIAYVKNGSDSDKNFDENNTPLQLSNDGTNQSLVYLKYDLSKLDQSKFNPGHSDGVKLRIYAKGDSNAKLNIYGLDKDSNWNQDTTWNKAPFKGTGSTKAISASPSYDPIQKENYYDFDVTDFVNSQNAGQVTLALQSQSGTSFEMGGGAKIGTQTHLNKPLDETPQLTVSNKNYYDYNYLDQIIKAARDADIKLEILWFGSDTTKLTTEHRVPYYVMHDYTMAKKSDGSLDISKQGPTVTTGQYQFNLDKNDPNLQKQEGAAVSAVFNHIAENNQQNGNTDTVIGAQMPNEPTISKSYTQPSTDLQAKMGMSDSDFKTWTLWNYTNNLDASVKNSAYPVWTRVNNAAGDGGDSIIALNENKRASATTNLDAVGLDDYQASYQSLYNYGHSKPYANGDNIPMIMEDGMGANDWSWAKGNYTPLDAGLRTITALAGGATRNYYDFMSGDGFDLYDGKNSDGTFAAHEYAGGKAIESVRNVNHFLDKMGHDLATKQADGAGGKQMVFFNAVPTNSYNFTDTKKLNQTDVTYHVDTNKSMGIAIQRDADDIVLGNTLDSNATFTLKNFGNVTAVTYGQYENPQSNKWTTTDGNVTYKKNTDGTYTITVPKFAVVNVSKKVTPVPTTNPTVTVPTTPDKPTTSTNTTTPGTPAKPDTTTTSSSQKKFRSFKVMTVKPVYEYSKTTFSKKNRVKFVAKRAHYHAPVFTVVGTAKSVNGVLRYKLSNGHYITAKSAYVVKLYLQGNHKVLKVINPQGIQTYSTTRFTKKTAVKHLKKGTLVKVKRVAKYGNGTRYQMTNGDYITGNKRFVSVFK